MSKKTLNYVRLGDLVTESFLLREMSPYGCPDAPGRLYGYNPVEKKCVDITDYEGPDRPAPIKQPKFDRKTKADIVDKDGYEISKEGVKELVVDVSKILTSFSEMQNCAVNHPYASIAGLLLGGGGAHMIAAGKMVKAMKVAIKGGAKFAIKQTVKTLFSPGRLAVLGALAMAYYAFKEDDKSFLQNVGAVAYGGEFGKLTFPDWAQKVENTMTEIENWTDVNKGNIACFTAAVVGAAAAYTLVRGVGIPVAKKMWSKGSTHAKRLGRRLGRALNESISSLGKGSSETSLFLLLKNEGKLGIPSPMVQLVDVGQGKSVLKLSTGSPTIKVAVSELPEEVAKKYGKFIKDGEFILEPSAINRELAELSDDALERTMKNYTDEAGEAIIDGQGQNIKRLMRNIGRGIETTAGAQASYFKETGGLFVDLIENSKPMIKELYESSLDLKRLENIMGLDDVAMKQIRKQAIESGANSAAAAGKLVDDGVVSAAMKEELVEFMTKFAKQSDAEKSLATKLETVQKLLAEEAKFADMFGSGGSGTPQLKDFMWSPDSRGLRKYHEELKHMLPTFGEMAATQSIRTVLRKVFLLGGVAGAVYTATVVSDKLEGFTVELHAAKIIELSEEFAKTITASEYEKGEFPNVNRDVDKLLDNFYKFSKAKTGSGPTERELLDVLQSFVQIAKDTQQVDDYFNKQEEMTVGDDKALRADFLNMIDNEFSVEREKEATPKEPEKEDTEEKEETEQPVATKGLLEQMPEGQEFLTDPPTALPISILGKATSVKFENRGGEGVLSVGKKEFQFTSPMGTGRIISAKRVGSRFHMKLKAGFLTRTYKLSEKQLARLFSEANKESFQPGMTKKFEKIDDDNGGDIKRIAEQDKNSQEVKIMSKENLSDLVKQILLENSGKGYSQYPYGSSVREEEEPKDDYLEDWKSLSLDLIRDESRNTAIEIAKILVKDLELFEDVLDLAGQNQSVGQEILRKLQESKEEV